MSTNQDVFNQIAPSWYNYRHWSIFRAELEMLAKRWQNGRLLNAGCGHGADFLPFCAGFELHGVDFSVEMPLKALMMPTTVPNRPTKGAVEPMVARPLSPRFSSA